MTLANTISLPFSEASLLIVISLFDTSSRIDGVITGIGYFIFIYLLSNNHQSSH